MATYTQSQGTEDNTYFQDVAISPATVADGSLLARLDTKRYPKVGVHTVVAPTITAVTPATGAHGTAVTLTITGGGFANDSTVAVSGANVTITNVVNVNHKGNTLTATATIAAGAAVGARDVTVTNTDTGAVTATGALTIT